MVTPQLVHGMHMKMMIGAPVDPAMEVQPDPAAQLDLAAPVRPDPAVLVRPDPAVIVTKRKMTIGDIAKRKMTTGDIAKVQFRLMGGRVLHDPIDPWMMMTKETNVAEARQDRTAAGLTNPTRERVDFTMPAQKM